KETMQPSDQLSNSNPQPTLQAPSGTDSTHPTPRPTAKWRERLFSWPATRWLVITVSCFKLCRWLFQHQKDLLSSRLDLWSLMEPVLWQTPSSAPSTSQT